MSRLDRRQFVVLLGALGNPACHARPRREAALRALVEELALSDVNLLASRSADLRRSAERLSSLPSSAELGALRAAWRRAAHAWKRASAFRWGPLLESGALARANYWPARLAAVDALLDGPREVTRELVDELGADVKGVYALEYLLFEPEGPSRLLPELDVRGAHRARDLVRIYAEDVDAQALRARRAFVATSRSFADSLVQRPTEALARIATMLVENVEALLIARFRTALWLAALSRLEASAIEGEASGISHELVLTLLSSTHRLYRGAVFPGVADLVRSSAPRVHEHVEALFARCIAIVRALPAIGEAARRRRPNLEAANSALKALETALRSELPNALGVSLAFTGLDAD
ncbi:MAG TPA: imelysin family protein [Polyangiaceae bacterium]|nr:imelysin family protein [Polyangiaceae bacterium]